MKKIILIVLGLVMIFNISSKKVSASTSKEEVSEPIVVKVGSNLNNYIKYDNYVVVSNSVNINEAGIYTITYKNIDTLEEVKKEVHVIEDDTYAFEANYRTLYAENNAYELVDCVEYDDKVAWLINYKRNNIFNNYYLYTDNIYNNTIRQSTKDQMVDLAYANGFIIVGNGISDINGDQNIMVCNYNLDGKYLVSQYQSLGKEEAKCITGSNNYIFVGGVTNEQTEMFNNKRKGYDSFILMIDRKTNELKNSLLLALDGDDEIIDIEFLDNYLYVIQSDNNSKLRLLKLDIFGNIIYENILSFNYGFLNPKLKNINNKLYLSYDYYEYEHLDYVSIIEEVNEELIRCVVYQKYEEDLVFKDYNLLDNGVLKIVYSYKNNPKNYCYKLFLDKKELFRLNGHQQMEIFGLYNDYVVLKSSNTIMVNKINSVAVAKDFQQEINPKYENNDVLDNYLVLIDGKDVSHSLKSNLEINSNLYGDYEVSYYFEDSILYLETVSVKLLPYVGVEDNKVYDQGVILDGNAVIRVNGELVDAPYKIEEVGEYKIELTGLNNQVNVLNIKVSQLRDVIIDKENNDYLEVKKEKNVIDNNAVVLFEEVKNKTLKQDSYLYFYLMPLIFMGLGFLVVKRG